MNTTITTTEREVVLTRVFDAPCELVFEAWTKPEYLQQWLLGPEGWSMPVCEVDLRAGGAWHYGWRNTNGNEMQMHGVFREIVPPTRIVTTENWGGPWPETLNTFTFSEAAGKTTMTITILYPSQEARDAALATGMAKGVEKSYDRLAALLSSRQ